MELDDCPICFESGVSLIEVCQSKHKVCAPCIIQVEHCPMCRQDITAKEAELTCRLCKINPPIDNGKCKYCKSYDYSQSVVDQVLLLARNGPAHKLYVKNYKRYDSFIKKYSNICDLKTFNTVLSHVKKDTTSVELAINITNGLYFTAEQAQVLVTRTWPEEYYRWQNALVFRCLDINKLSVSEFASGMCYYGHFGEPINVPWMYVEYIVKRSAINGNL